MENSLGIDTLVSVRSEIIALGLNEIGWHPRAAISIQITERNHQTGQRNSELARRADEAAQVFLMIHNLVRDVWVEEQIGKVAPGLERGADARFLLHFCRVLRVGRNISYLKWDT